MPRAPAQLAAPPGGEMGAARGARTVCAVHLVWVLPYHEEISETKF